MLRAGSSLGTTAEGALCVTDLHLFAYTVTDSSACPADLRLVAADHHRLPDLRLA